MTPLEILKAALEFKDLQRNVSTVTLLWAVCSIAAVALKQINLIANYEQALPVVVLVTWIGAEIAARLPKRVPVATCEACSSLQTLPMGALRRFWPWKRCSRCGGYLRYTCPNNHLLSLFDNEKTEGVKKLWCSRCGETHTALNEKEFLEQLRSIARRRPKDFDDTLELANLIWMLVKGTGLQSDVEKGLDIFVIKFLMEGGIRYSHFLTSIGLFEQREHLSVEELDQLASNRNRKKGGALVDAVIKENLTKPK
jgi:hypothetical protein